MKLAYYPGCVSRSTGKEMDLSTRAVCSALGIDLEELADWSCCGATHEPNELVSVGIAARNLTQTDLPIMTACSICFSNLRNAALRMEEPDVAARLNEVLHRPYGGAQIRHILDVIIEAIRKEDDRLVVPLKDLKVAPYYGCLLTRPRGSIDSPENPTIIERLIKNLLAEPVNFGRKTFCCGGPIFMSEERAAAELSFLILKEARQAKADLIVTVCPMCQLMLDSRQKILEQRHNERMGIPVLYVTQLAGIALGLGPEELGLNKNSVSPMPMLEKVYERIA